MSQRWRSETKPLWQVGVDRRTALRTTSAVLLAPVAAPESARARGRFFSAAEWTMVDELAEIIVPADAHSPGARAAGVVAEVDRRFADTPVDFPEGAKARRAFREGLRRVDALARRLHGASFSRNTPAQQLAVVSAIARHESDPRRPEDHFFVQLKTEVVNAYYGSEIGLKQDLGYLGNSYLEEFVGADAASVPIKKRP